MMRKIILRLSFIVAFLTLLWSCRNEDFAQAEKNPQRNNQDFFKHTKNNDGLARTGVDYVDILEAYNKEKDFLAQMPDQKGMPIWEKMQVFDGGTATALIIPLSDDNKVLSSLLFATVDSKMQVLGVRNFDNALLREIVYDETISRDYREYLFSTFMTADHYTFGTTHFTNIPKDLFVKQKYNDHLGRISIKDISFSNVTSNENGRILIIKTCYIVLHCTHHGTGACDAIDGCTDCGTEYCTYSVVTTSGGGIPSTNTGPGGISSPGTGSDGGGSGTPSVIPGPDPCGLTKAFYRLAPGCSGNPDAPEFEDPCSKIKKSTDDSKYKSNITNLEGKIGLDHEEGYRLGTPISGSGQAGTQNQLLQNLPGTHEVDMKIFSNTFALMHTHYDGIYPIFSPGDILLFNNWIVWANTWNAVPTNTPKIPLNNLTLTVVTSNGNYLLAFDGSVVDPLPAYTQEEFDDLNDKYKIKYLDNANNNGNFNMERLEKEFLKFVNERMNMTGLKLYRVKSDGNYEISLSDLEGTKCP